MKRVHSPEKLNYYINKYQMQDHFSTDLTSIAELLQYDKKELLIHQDSKSSYLLFLVDGELKIYTYSTSSYVQTRQYYEANAQILGEVSGFWDFSSCANVIALTKCTCIGIYLPRYRDLLLNDNQFLRYLNRQMSERLSTQGCFTEPLEIRLAKFMKSHNTNNKFIFNLTECADILNTSNRHLFRTLNQFCTHNILKKEAKGYQILNPQLLEEIISGNKKL